MKAWNHFKTITHHKFLVMKGCFRLGLYRQGLLHDLSKYSPSEFLVGVRYYQGNRSPNAAEKEEKGYSSAWLHHKGRNKHHYEYWIDADPRNRVAAIGVKMPIRYLAEMFVDRVAASKTYQGASYTDASALMYYERTKDLMLMHDDTRAMLVKLLTMLKDEGEEKTFRFIKERLLTGKEPY